MKIYLLQCCKRINQCSNKELFDAAAFTKFPKVMKYMEENRESVMGEGKVFWKVLETEERTGELFFHSAYDLDGNRTYLFSQKERV